MLQELQGADPPAGREPAGLHGGLQRKATQEEGAQAEDHPGRRGGHSAGPSEQGADGAVAEGKSYCLYGWSSGQRWYRTTRRSPWRTVIVADWVMIHKHKNTHL